MGVSWSFLPSSRPTSKNITVQAIASPGFHPTFCFEDGSLVLQVEKTRFGIHRTMLTRQSRYLAERLATGSNNPPNNSALNGETGVDMILGPSKEVNITSQDFVVLLEHLYHDSPLQIETRFTRIAAILRITGPDALDCPNIHSLALERLNMILPSSSKEIEGLKHKDTLMRKFLHYDAVTSPDPTPEDTEADNTEVDPSKAPITPASDGSSAAPPATSTTSPSPPDTDSELVSSLMTRLIEHFSPTIFTPPPTSHMECTDVLADIWLECVIQPALANDGVYKPLETLEDMKEVDWVKRGICEGCVKEKREEWTEEQRVVWNLMDGWLVEGATS